MSTIFDARHAGSAGCSSPSELRSSNELAVDPSARVFDSIMGCLDVIEQRFARASPLAHRTDGPSADLCAWHADAVEWMPVTFANLTYFLASLEEHCGPLGDSFGRGHPPVSASMPLETLFQSFRALLDAVSLQSLSVRLLAAARADAPPADTNPAQPLPAKSDAEPAPGVFDTLHAMVGVLQRQWELVAAGGAVESAKPAPSPASAPPSRVDPKTPAEPRNQACARYGMSFATLEAMISEVQVVRAHLDVMTLGFLEAEPAVVVSNESMSFVLMDLRNRLGRLEDTLGNIGLEHRS
jgi:hypothetical protein